MEIKLFGKSLFSAKSKGDQLYEMAVSESKKGESKYLPDFYERRHGVNGNALSNYIELQATPNSWVAVPEGKLKKGKKVKEVKKKQVKPITPKGVFELQLLHDKSFKLNTNPEHVDKQLEDFKTKLGMINAEEYDMRHGVEEITSIITRLENRKIYAENKEVFENFPYTTTTRIAEVIKKHDNLEMGKIAQFIADLPKEAIDVMKQYEEATVKVCSKKPVYYIISDKKDFKKSDNRRDPILLAQSPFGHVWQILGAWDKEMMFLQEL